MPQAIIWTVEQDAIIFRMRANGATWQAIADAMGLSRNAVLDRGNRIGAKGGPTPMQKAKPAITDRPGYTLPPGHPIAWAILTAGTLLEGTEFRR